MRAKTQRSAVGVGARDFRATSSVTSTRVSLPALETLPRKAAGDRVEYEFEAEAERVAEWVTSCASVSAAAPPDPPSARVVSPAVATDSRVRSPGRPLESSTRGSMERQFGRDFSDVRVHTDADAARSAVAAGALAFTSGRDVVFAPGRYAPHTAPGRRLLAHELTHVVQQRIADRPFGPAPAITQRGVPPVLARAAAPDAAEAPANAPAPPVADTRNYEALAAIIFKAIEGWGTDEEAVYGALEVLNREPAAIEKLKATYAAKYPGHDLIADIRDDFSGTELEFALQLVNLGDPKAAQRIEATADTTPDGLARAARRLHDAFEVFLGTDEEAVFAVLLPFKRDPAALGSLRDVYQRNFRESLKERIFDEFSGSELEHALFLFLTPPEAYEYFLLKASKDLSGGVPGGRSVGDPNEQKSGARYDRSFWTTGNPQNPQGYPEVLALRLREGKRPSEAVQAMYDSMSQNAATAYAFGSWRADCAEWVQVHHLYAMLKTLGPYRFDERFGAQPFWFKPQRSTGLKARMLYARDSAGEKLKPRKLIDGQPELDVRPGRASQGQPLVDETLPEVSAEEMLAKAPIGSRVAWFNNAIRYPAQCGISVVTPEMQGFAIENTIKLGPDYYGAHGFGLTVNMNARGIIDRSLGYGEDPRLSKDENRKRTVFVGEIEIYQTVADEPWR